ncbi:MAG: pyridoxamine 5'-phosphate oxidase family protein [Actinomycetota bacterium]|nr:pyridoxamine 5'-phosphate oxidase family protein [Actinomycetota bacterium]
MSADAVADATTSPIVEVTTEQELRHIIGEVMPTAAAKVSPALSDLHRDWLAASPLCLIGTADITGNADVSPKGDPAGFTLVLDDTTIALPDRPGNRRVDGWLNVLANPHVGLIFLIPGRGDTLHINGRGRLVRDAPFFDDLVVQGHRPKLALVVDIDEVFFHCSKAFLRSKLWDPTTWAPDALPSRAVISHRMERADETIEAVEEYYGPSYEKNLYR